MADEALTIQPQVQVYTLADLTEEYMLERQIFNEKYYPSYLKYAKNAWCELFYDTLYIYNARWVKLMNINGTYVIPIPAESKGFISANLIDECGILQRIPLNSYIGNIPKKPTVQFNCKSVIESFIVNTKYLFTNNGVDYFEKTYIKYCPNGDIIEVTETPAKKYGDTTGDIVGSYNNDYNDDYQQPDAFSNYTIETEKKERMLSNLETGEDGCPLDTQENIKKLTKYCGCYSHIFQHKYNDAVINSLEFVLGANEYGSVNISEDGKNLVYTPPKQCHHLQEIKIPDYVLVYFKGSALGNEITGAAIIPDDWFIQNAMILGIDHYSKRLNTKYTQNEKQAARFAFDDAINNIIRNKLLMSIDTLLKLGEIKVRW